MATGADGPGSDHSQRATGLTVCGLNAVAEALNSGRSLERLYVRSGPLNERQQALMRKARKAGIPVSVVPEPKLLRYAQNHQGLVAILSPVNYCGWEEVVQRAYEQGEDPLVLVCDRITDVRNFGAIARTAWITGVHGLIVPKKESAAINAETVRASAGALLHQSISRVASLKNVLVQLRQMGITVAAASAGAGLLPDEADLNRPLALVIGSEGSGIAPALLQEADWQLQIPMHRQFDSYNVSAAAAILLYEVMRQRRGRTINR